LSYGQAWDRWANNGMQQLMPSPSLIGLDSWSKLVKK